MNLLMITARFPYPPHKGDQVVSYNMIRELSKGHKIVLLSLGRTVSAEHVEEVQRYCDIVLCIRRGVLSIAMGILVALFRWRIPVQVLVFRKRRLERIVKSLVVEHGIEIVHAYTIRTAQYTTQTSLPVLLELIDSMQLNLARRIQNERGFMRQIVREEIRRLRRYEPQVCELADRVVVVAEEDGKILRRSNVSTLGIGVDCTRFSPLDLLVENPFIVFTGNLSYFPNVEASVFFASDVFPLVKQRIPDARLLIVGRDPAKEVMRLKAIRSVTVLANVLDMATTLRKARIAVAPMKSGSGMQIKILEAMASGLPVVTTTLGKGSLTASTGIEIIVADSVEDFANKVVWLLDNIAKARSVGAAARQFVLENHSWSERALHVNKIYKEIAAS